MSHMVIFQTKDGNPGYNQFDDVDGAVRFVEELRNEQGIENARIFALEEVRFQMKQIFKVELNPPTLTAGGSTGTSSPTSFGADPAPSQPSPAATPASAPSGATEFGSSPFGSSTDTSVPPPPAEGGDEPMRRGLFGR